MSAVAQLQKRHVGTVADDFFSKYREVQINQDREIGSASRIQKAWRGFVIRRNLVKIIFATTNIQSQYRSHLGRKRWANRQREVAAEERDEYFKVAATEVQRCWRGFRSRK